MQRISVRTAAGACRLPRLMISVRVAIEQASASLGRQKCNKSNNRQPVQPVHSSVQAMLRGIRGAAAGWDSFKGGSLGKSFESVCSNLEEAIFRGE